jgi:hypothetical protein
MIAHQANFEPLSENNQQVELNDQIEAESRSYLTFNVGSDFF